MITVLTCLGTQHDARLLLLAFLICAAGVFATMRLYQNALHRDPLVRMAWTFLAATIAAGAAWSTHFVAMLAYLAGAPVHYDPVLTLTSLIVALLGAQLGLLAAASPRYRACPCLGGAVLGLGVAAMHYVGMLAWRVEGRVHWHTGFVAASVALATLLSAAAFGAARGKLGARLAPWSPAILAAAFLSLHFTGMAAIDVTVLNPLPERFDHEALGLALAITLVGLMVVGIGSFAWLIDQRARRATAEAHRIDGTTGMPNREGFLAALAGQLDSALPGARIRLAAIKLDRFHELIERHGDAVGEEVIAAVGRRLLAACKPGVVMGRTGRFEFSIAGPSAPEGEVRVRFEHMLATLSVPLVVRMEEYRINPRIGSACWPEDAAARDDLVTCAHLALERALADPLAPLCFYDEWQDAAARRRHALAIDLAGALARGEFEMHYQPQVFIETGAVIGQEALIRWRHPRFGMVSPAEFIPLAEHTGEIVGIGDWALRTACKAATRWPEDWRVAVNVSPLQLRQPDLPERVHAALIAAGLPPRRLEIELTESLLLDDRVRALHVLRRIRALGVRLALDDFGTGYSSLDVLRHFPFDKVKLDKTFVDDVENNPQARAILHAMLALGRALDIPVLVEGVETEHQLAILRAEGCRKVQGYLTGRPVEEKFVLSNREAPMRKSA